MFVFLIQLQEIFRNSQTLQNCIRKHSSKNNPEWKVKDLKRSKSLRERSVSENDKHYIKQIKSNTMDNKYLSYLQIPCHENLVARKLLQPRSKIDQNSVYNSQQSVAATPCLTPNWDKMSRCATPSAQSTYSVASFYPSLEVSAEDCNTTPHNLIGVENSNTPILNVEPPSPSPSSTIKRTYSPLPEKLPSSLLETSGDASISLKSLNKLKKSKSLGHVSTLITNISKHLLLEEK